MIKLKYLWDIFIFLGIEIAYLLHYFPRTNIFGKNSLCIPKELFVVLIPASQNAVSASMIAISILLPATIGIIYFFKDKTDIESQSVKDSIISFSLAALTFLVSLFCGVVVMGFMPVRLKLNINITLDFVILLWATTHFTSFALGVFKLIIGLIFVRKVLVSPLKIKKQTQL